VGLRAGLDREDTGQIISVRCHADPDLDSIHEEDQKKSEYVIDLRHAERF
jgi:hypothetical protein